MSSIHPSIHHIFNEKLTKRKCRPTIWHVVPQHWHLFPFTRIRNGFQWHLWMQSVPPTELPFSDSCQIPWHFQVFHTTNHRDKSLHWTQPADALNTLPKTVEFYLEKYDMSPSVNKVNICEITIILLRFRNSNRFKTIALTKSPQQFQQIQQDSLQQIYNTDWHSRQTLRCLVT